MSSKAVMRDKEDEEDEDHGLFISVKNLILMPVRVALSKPARRAYVTTFLVAISGSILFGLAVTAYTLFYWSYIPRVGFERPIHLQFDLVLYQAPGADAPASKINPHPHGTIVLSPDLVSSQRYDVSIELSLPRTRENRAAGNFMLEATMFASGSVVDTVKEGIMPGLADEDNKLAVSRRPAILVYRSIVVEYLWKLTELHWYLLNFRGEAEKLTVKMFEGVEFSRGWRNVPSTMRLEIQSTHRLQIYSAKAVFKARFRGLRWLLYNHRIISAFVFITGFWVTEMIFAGLAWAAISISLAKPPAIKNEELHELAERVKSEEETDDEKPELSDTERTFPTLSNQLPLRYESPHIKQEEDDDMAVLPEPSNRATEADDEDDLLDSFHDSGLGTGLESSGSRRDTMRRRRSGVGSRDGLK